MLISMNLENVLFHIQEACLLLLLPLVKQESSSEVRGLEVLVSMDQCSGLVGPLFPSLHTCSFVRSVQIP